MAEKPKPTPTPPNFHAVWHRGDFSTFEIYTNEIRNGYPVGTTYEPVDYVRDEMHQLPEEVFKTLYLKAIALCGLHPELMVSVIRNDKASEVPENDNNRPFIMPSSPRYFEGAERKDIVYEGTIFHSDPSTIRRIGDQPEVIPVKKKSKMVYSSNRQRKKRGENKRIPLSVTG